MKNKLTRQNTIKALLCSVCSFAAQAAVANNVDSADKDIDSAEMIYSQKNRKSYLSNVYDIDFTVPTIISPRYKKVAAREKKLAISGTESNKEIQTNDTKYKGGHLVFDVDTSQYGAFEKEANHYIVLDLNSSSETNDNKVHTVQIDEDTILKDIYNLGSIRPNFTIGRPYNLPALNSALKPGHANDKIKRLKEPKMPYTKLQLGHKGEGDLSAIKGIEIYKPAHIIFWGKKYNNSDESSVDINSIANYGRHRLFIDAASDLNIESTGQHLEVKSDTAESSYWKELHATRVILRENVNVKTDVDFHLSSLLIGKNARLKFDRTRMEKPTVQILDVKRISAKKGEIHLVSNEDKIGKLQITRSEKVNTTITTSSAGQGELLFERIKNIDKKLNVLFAGSIGSKDLPFDTIKLSHAKLDLDKNAQIWGDIKNGFYISAISFESGSQVYGEIGTTSSPMRGIYFKNIKNGENPIKITGDIFTEKAELDHTYIDFAVPLRITSPKTTGTSPRFNLHNNKIEHKGAMKLSGDVVFDTKIAGGRAGTLSASKNSVIDLSDSRLTINLTQIQDQGGAIKSSYPFLQSSAENTIYLPTKENIIFANLAEDNKGFKWSYDLSSRSIIAQKPTAEGMLNSASNEVLGIDQTILVDDKRLETFEKNNIDDDSFPIAPPPSESISISDLGSEMDIDEEFDNMEVEDAAIVTGVGDGVSEFELKELAKFGEDSRATPRTLMGAEKIIQSASSLGNKVTDRMLELESGDMFAPAAGDSDRRRARGIWVSCFAGMARKGLHAEIDGYKSRSKGISMGFDTEFTDRLTLGVAGGLVTSDFSYRNGKEGDTSSTVTKLFSVYGSYEMPCDSFVQSMVSYSHVDVRYTDNRATSEGTKYTARGKFKAGIVSGQLMYGRNYKIRDGKFTLTPVIGARVNHFYENPYTETGAGSRNLVVDSRKITRSEGIIGIKTSMLIEKGNLKIVPEFDCILHHDFNTKPLNVRAKIINTNTVLPTKMEEINRTSLNLGAAVNLKSGRFECKLEYDAYLSKKYVGQQASLKLRINF